MKKFLALFALAIIAISAVGQSAKVIPLSDQDAAERKSLEDQRAAIEQKIKDFDQRIRVQYTTVLEGDKDSSGSIEESYLNALGTTIVCYHNLTGDSDIDEQSYKKCVRDLAAERAKNPPKPKRMYRKGWEHGVVYSEDWKFIVPNAQQVTSITIGGNGSLCYNSIGCPNYYSGNPYCYGTITASGTTTLPYDYFYYSEK